MSTPPFGPHDWPGHPPPGYPGPAYQSGHHPGYPPPYGHRPPAITPGIIPLRPLSVGEIFSGALAYVRTNPAVTLGITAVIVALSAIVELVAELTQPTVRGGADVAAAVLAGGIATGLANILLSGLLTVVVARAVLGGSITARQAWERVRGRLPSLIVLTLAEIVAVVVIIAATVGVIAGVAAASNPGFAAVLGVPLVILTLAVLAYLFTALTFAPVAIVLERKPVIEAVRRSLRLARHHFWRILGVRLLAGLIAVVVAGAVTVPFSLFAALLSAGPEAPGPAAVAAVVSAVGGAIGQIITAPFTAGVAVLLYVDARMRSEAFDRVLQTGAFGATAASADDLWLTGTGGGIVPPGGPQAAGIQFPWKP